MKQEKSEDESIDQFYNWIRNYWCALSQDPVNGCSGLLNFGCWDNNPANLYEAQDRLFNICIQELRPFQAESKGLEVGCGIGGNSLRLCLNEPVTMTAIDISEDQLTVATKLADEAGCGDKITYMHGNSMAMPFNSGSFDFSICIESTFHYSSVARFIMEQKRVLKPGKLAVIADITCEKYEKVKFRKGNFFCSMSYLTGLLKKSGLEILNVNRIGPYVFEPLYRYVSDYNTYNHSKVAKYWNLVLCNYANLARRGLMGYDIFVVRKPMD